MIEQGRNLLSFFLWLGKIMYLWVRSTVHPQKDPLKALQINSEHNICYVFKTLSFTDLLVLDYYCKKFDLPRPLYTPKHPQQKGQATFIYLQKPGMLQRQRSRKIPTDLVDLVEKVALPGALDMQLIPVSVFWGRNPGQEEKSLFKLIFFDDENGGWFQRFVTFFVQGRRVFCNLGKPISVQSVLEKDVRFEQTARKIRRVLRVHFRTQREIVLGPNLYNRRQVLYQVVTSKNVSEAIRSEAQRKNEDIVKIERKAWQYADELAANMSPNMIRFLDIALTWVWRKIFSGVEVHNDEHLRELASKYELIYMPAHRSHLDYLLLSYIVYSLGLLPPHIVAGLNLSFWPLGPMFRRGGAFFIRRSFKGDRLYKMVVQEYLNFLTSSGFGICFFPEGGRSRTGFLLQPKLGVLSMLAQNTQEQAKPILLVPVYIGYDKVIEARSYARELGGAKKKTESIRGLLKARKILKAEFGKVYIGFGKGVELPLPKDGEEQSTAQITTIAEKVAMHTNDAAVLCPSALFCTLVLSTPKHAITQQELVQYAIVLLKLFSKNPYTEHVSCTLKADEEEIKKGIEYVVALKLLSSEDFLDNKIIKFTSEQATLANYYKNNTAHLFVMPSLIAAFIQFRESFTLLEIQRGFSYLYAFLKEEHFLHELDEQALSTKVTAYILSFNELGLIHSAKDNLFHRPEVMEIEFAQLKFLANIGAAQAEKYVVFALLLKRLGAFGQEVDTTNFIKQCEILGQRMFLLTGRHDFQNFDQRTLKPFFQLLQNKGLVSGNEEKIFLQDTYYSFIEDIQNLLSPEVRAGIKRTLLIKEESRSSQ